MSLVWKSSQAGVHIYQREPIGASSLFTFGFFLFFSYEYRVEQSRSFYLLIFNENHYAFIGFL